MIVSPSVPLQIWFLKTGRTPRERSAVFDDEYAYSLPTF